METEIQEQEENNKKELERAFNKKRITNLEDAIHERTMGNFSLTI